MSTMFGRPDPRELERQRLMAQYGGQVPPVGIQGSVPAAPMPELRQSSPLELQRINQAGRVDQQFSPVMQPTLQSSVNAMFQPQSGAMQKQIGNVTQGNVVNPPAPETTSEFMKSMGGGGTDWKGMAKDLAKGLKSSGLGSGQSLMNQEIENIGLLQQAKSPQMGIGAAMQQPQQQAGMSGAMQAITSGIGSEPAMLEMLKRMRR